MEIDGKEKPPSRNLKKSLKGGTSLALVSAAKSEAKEAPFVPEASQKVQIILDTVKTRRNHSR
jgi:hypothetical protein